MPNATFPHSSFFNESLGRPHGRSTSFGVSREGLTTNNCSDVAPLKPLAFLSRAFSNPTPQPVCQNISRVSTASPNSPEAIQNASLAISGIGAGCLLLGFLLGYLFRCWRSRPVKHPVPSIAVRETELALPTIEGSDFHNHYRSQRSVSQTFE